MGSRHQAAGGRHAEPEVEVRAPGAPSRPTPVPPLPPLTGLRVVDEPGAEPAEDRFPAFGQLLDQQHAPAPATGSRRLPTGPSTGSQSPSAGSRRPPARGPATGTRRPPGRNVRWVPVALAIWIASFLAVPAAVLVNQAVSAGGTEVQNTADTSDRTATTDEPAADAGSADGVAADPSDAADPDGPARDRPVQEAVSGQEPAEVDPTEPAAVVVDNPSAPIAGGGAVAVPPALAPVSGQVAAASPSRSPQSSPASPSTAVVEVTPATQTAVVAPPAQPEPDPEVEAVVADVVGP